MMSATHYVDECVMRAFDRARKLLNDETFVYSPHDIVKDELKDQFEQQCRERFADTHLIYMGEEDKVKDACLGLITWTIRNEENLSPNQKVEKIDGFIREMEDRIIPSLYKILELSEQEKAYAAQSVGVVLTGDGHGPVGGDAGEHARNKKKRMKNKGHSV